MNPSERLWHLYLAVERDRTRFSAGSTSEILARTANLSRKLSLDTILSVHYSGDRQHVTQLLDELYLQFSDFALIDPLHPDDEAKVYRGSAFMQVRQWITANAQAKQIRLGGRLPFNADYRAHVISQTL
jgi:hypothetical protein